MIITAPTVIWLPRKRKPAKRFALNLNVYRNAHYQVLNQAKRQFKDEMHSQIIRLPILTPPASVEYFVYFAQRRGDVMNVGAVVDKFFCDALVTAGKIKDDDYKYLPVFGFKFGRIDKKRPRCEIMLRGIK